MEIFDTSKSLIENIYLLSGPLIAILGLAGIIQLKLTKKAIIISSKREAAKFAANQIDVYLSHIMPLINQIFDSEKKEKINGIKLKTREFNNKAVIEELGIEKVAEVFALRMKNPKLKLLNSIEAFSTYFTKGIADEEIAFSAVGLTFCNTIESLHFDIAICRKKEEEYSFQNLVSLYEIWSSRLKKEKLSREKDEILNQINKINNDKVNPIGTK